MSVDVDPKVDYAFKHLLGRESTRPILLHLVNSILQGQSDRQIRDLELLNPFNPKEAFDDKLSILDVKARAQSGEQLNIEMQMLAYRFYEKRILYYWAIFHQQQLHEGQDYLMLRPTISISFLDHELFQQAPEYQSRFRLRDDMGRAQFSDIELHIFELPKFKKSPAELTSDLDAWLYFLRYAETMEEGTLPLALQQPIFRRALRELTMLNQTHQERELYEARRKWQLDYNTGLKVARLEGREEGRQVGEQIGRIHQCERLLGQPQTPSAELRELQIEELGRRADELERLLVNRS